MYICVIFTHSKVVRVVPISWRKGHSIAAEPAKKIPPNEVQTIFFSPDDSTTPDFSLPLSAEFDFDEDRCYHGHILKFVGEFALK